MEEINPNEDIPNFMEFNIEAEKIKTENLKEEIKKDSNSNNYNLENISSFDSNEFCKMDLKNSFELENKDKGFASPLKNLIANNFEDNLNLDYLANDFIVPNNFNNFNNYYFNDFNNLDNLAVDFNTNVHLHVDNFNPIDYLDKSKINTKIDEKGKREKLNFNNKNKINYNPVLVIKENNSRKKKKIDLNKTPLPVFACIYCSNENVVFKHMTNEIISDKYLYNCGPQNLKNINIIVSTYFVYDLPASVNAEIKSLVNLILNYSEYFSKIHPLKNSKEFIKNYFANKFIKDQANSENAAYKPLLKYRFFCTENTMMTFFFKNTSNFKIYYMIN